MGNIYQAITSIMEEGYAISKDKRNNTQGFMYRGIDDVMNTFQPLLAKHHIFIVPEVLEQTREERTTSKGATMMYSLLKTKYTFFAEDGTSVSAVVVGEGMDSGDKASNKAMSVAMKYAMFQVFCIPTEEMQDPDADTPPPTSPHFACEECGRQIPGYKDANGNPISARRWDENTQKTFGRALCDKCVEREQMLAKARSYGVSKEEQPA